MKKISIILISVLALALNTANAQQRSVFSTYIFNPLVLNPAYAGSLDLFSAIVTNRNQWVNIDGAPNYQSISAHTAWVNNRVGTGFVATRDAIGVHEQYGVYGSYAYKVRFAHGVLAMGMQGGFDNRNSNYTLLSLKDASDPLLSSDAKKFNPNFGVGLYYSNPKFFMGVSVPYILNSKVFKVESISSSEREARYYYVHTGMVLEMNSSIKFNPSVLLRLQERSPVSFDINANLIFEDIIFVGVSYRSGAAVVFLSQIVLNENFRFGYAFDTESSSLSGFTPGTHEIFLNYRIKIKNLKKNPQCPVYF